MNQDNHEAHDDTVVLTSDTAQEVLDFMNDHDAADVSEAHEEVVEKLEAIADGDDDTTLTAEQAKLAADFVRERSAEGEQGDLLESLDAVAKQHGGAAGAQAAGESGDAEHDENLR